MSARAGRYAVVAAVLVASALLGRPAHAQPPPSPAAIQLGPVCAPAAGALPAIAVAGVDFNPFTAVLVTFDAAAGGTPESFDASTDGFGAFHVTIQPGPRPAGSYVVRADDFRERESTATFAVPCGSPPPPPQQTFQPAMHFVPAVTRVGFVVSLRGTGFPPSAVVSLRWGGIFGRATPGRDLPATVTTGADGSLEVRSILIFQETDLGTRTAIASPGGPEVFGPVPGKLLIVPGTAEPPHFLERR